MSLPDSPWQLIILLVVLSLLPLAVVMGTSFLKLAVVLSILRNALWIQQVPPNMALILSLFIMAPTALAVKAQWHPVAAPGDPPWASGWDGKALTPYRKFLRRNADEKEIRYFHQLVTKTLPEEARRRVRPDSLLILLPAFTVSQLS